MTAFSEERSGANGMLSVKVPLDEFIREMARECTRVFIEEHIKTCVVHEVKQDVERNKDEISNIKLRFAWLVGAMIGSGLLGGGVASALASILGGR